MMKKFTLLHVGGTSWATVEWEVHAEGCRDVARKLRVDPFVDAYTAPAESAEALVESEVQVYTDQDQGWTADDHRIYPCCND